MRYWADFTSKYGFSDGTEVPDDAVQARAIYVQCLNAALERHGSAIRCFAYDRLGVHNTCMILSCSVTYYEQMDEEERIWGAPTYEAKECARDKAYYRAVEEVESRWEDAMDDLIPKPATIDEDALQALVKTIRYAKKVTAK